MYIEKEKTACFSGHRTHKIKNTEDMTANLNAILTAAIEQGYTHFISGACAGFDLLAAEAVIALKQKYPHIKLILAVPFPEQADKWANEAKQRYLRILVASDDMKLVSQSYYRGVYYVRNRFMVDNSSLLICYFNGSSGGTAYTVEYADKKGLRIYNLYRK